MYFRHYFVLSIDCSHQFYRDPLDYLAWKRIPYRYRCPLCILWDGGGDSNCDDRPNDYDSLLLPKEDYLHCEPYDTIGTWNRGGVKTPIGFRQIIMSNVIVLWLLLWGFDDPTMILNINWLYQNDVRGTGFSLSFSLFTIGGTGELIQHTHTKKRYNLKLNYRKFNSIL